MGMDNDGRPSSKLAAAGALTQPLEVVTDTAWRATGSVWFGPLLADS